MDWPSSNYKYDQTGSKSSAHKEFELLKKNDVFLEVGAFHGWTTIRAAKIVDKVIAVEPYPKNFAFLLKNLSKHEVTNVLPLCLAGWNRVEILPLVHAGKNDTSMSTKWDGMKECDVLGVPLDCLPSLRPSFIRIDAVGSEIEVLQGLRNTLKSKPTTIVISIGDNVKKVYSFMKHLGYSGEHITNTNAYLYQK